MAGKAFMAYVVMPYIVVARREARVAGKAIMAYVVMAYIVMARREARVAGKAARARRVRRRMPPAHGSAAAQARRSPAAIGVADAQASLVGIVGARRGQGGPGRGSGGCGCDGMAAAESACEARCDSSGVRAAWAGLGVPVSQGPAF